VINSTKCLFSGDFLSENEKPEHIIQVKLGGKITSRKIMTSKVNNSFSKIDNAIVSRYRPVMQNLYHLLPSKSKPGRMDVAMPIEGGDLVIDGGRIRPKRNVLEVVIDNKRSKLIGDVEQLPDYLKQKMSESEIIIFNEIKDENGDNFTFEDYSLSPDIDTAIIKIAASATAFLAISFDNQELIEAVSPLCNSVYAAIQNSSIKRELICNHSMGFQVETAVHFDTLIDKLWKSKKPFAHYVFCSVSPVVAQTGGLVK
jgi:hypothetical protein